MKKALLIMALGLISFTSFSQDAQYGVRAGYNISNLDFEPGPVSRNMHRNGFALGFFAEYNLSPSFAIAPELQYSAEGAKDEEFRVDYLNLPVLFKVKLGERFAIGVGPQASLKIHEFEDGYKNFVFSGVGGVEFMVSDVLFLDARFNYGFMNIFDDEIPFEAKNQNIQIGFGLKI
ncbi:MAG TPA: porin family protein [Flavobacteriaceae bacterium]|nr:porin family protein [Flavobacteriaceae bacterium]